MLKKRLEIVLEGLEGFKNPKILLEQYTTPPNFASFVVTNAHLFGDIGLVYDLGCGTGVLAIASAMLGAFAVGVDIDKEVLKTARENAKKVKVDVDFIACDVREFEVKKRGTVIMNPPFGIQKKHSDRPFLEKAFEIGDKIYSIHSAGSEEFIRKKAENSGFRVTHVWRFMMPLRKTYSFHEKAFKYIPVEIFRIERYEGVPGRQGWEC
ncbi:MAG: METTL5 family protein [Archaeoglobaceae archaeon]